MNPGVAIILGLVIGAIQSFYLQRFAKWEPWNAWYVGLISGITIWALLIYKFL
ncbi:MAG: hypothetical protein ACE5K4_06940 [Candidatus Hydrothermarchaeota archaeon]